MLNRRIQSLHNSRIEFAMMIKELNASVAKAEGNVHEMSELSRITGNEIKAIVEEAKEVSEELSAINDAAGDLSIRLNKQRKSLNKALYEIESAANSESSKDLEYIQEDKTIKKDLDIPSAEGIFQGQYAGQLKSFIQNIVGPKKSQEPSICLDQMSYYDSLRKINAKK